MRVGLVVEGSHLYHQRTHADLLEQLWATVIPHAVGSAKPTKVFGISKASLAAMQLRQSPLRRSTSIAEPLDAYLERIQRAHSIDCFVVIWDLVPPWDREAEMCRWAETLAFYEGLSLSDTLNRRFRKFAAARLDELRQRPEPGARRTSPKLVKGAVLAICVDPVFESIFMDERAMKAALGVSGKRVRGWPAGWDHDNADANTVIAAAVDAARDVTRSAPVFRRIRQGYETLKTEWGIHFIQSGNFDKSLRRHGLGIRLAEICVGEKRK